MKKSEIVTMAVDYSPGDPKMLSDEKENAGVNTPILDESILRMSKDSECKQHISDENVIEDCISDKTISKSVNESDSEESNQESGKKSNKKKPRRRNRGGKNHRKWKPYDKMSWTEKQELEEKETRRATQKREDAFASGHPVAPYNTTQFLMDDHFKNEAISPDLHRNNCRDSNISNSSDSSSDFYDENDNDGFQQRNFMDTFNDIRKQELMSRTKDDLVRDYVELEMKLEETTTVKRGDRSSRDDSDVNSVSSGNDRGDVDYTEYQRLKDENDLLRETNFKLKAQLKTQQNDENMVVN